MRPTNAHFVGTYAGKRVHRYHVVITMTHPRTLLPVTLETHAILAQSPADAMYGVRELPEVRRRSAAALRPFELFTAGPKGGRFTQYVSWDRIVWDAMCERRPGAKQLALPGTSDDPGVTS